MKKSLFSVIVFAVLMVTNTFATNINGNVNQKVITAFNQRFSKVSELSWIKSEDYFKACFTWNEQVMYAYFSETGEFFGTSRNVEVHQVPINLQSSLKKWYKNGWLSDLYEFATDEESAYFATVENADEKVVLMSTGTSGWTVYKKTRKN